MESFNKQVFILCCTSHTNCSRRSAFQQCHCLGQTLWSQGEPTGKDLCDLWEKTAHFSILFDVEPNFAVLRKNPKTYKEAEQEARGSWEEGKQKAGVVILGKRKKTHSFSKRQF